jgi:hypothetical protein
LPSDLGKNRFFKKINGTAEVTQKPSKLKASNSRKTKGFHKRKKRLSTARRNV